MKDKILRIKIVSELVGMSRTTIWRLEKESKFPKRMLIGKRSIGWRNSDIQKWINKN